MQFAYSKKRSDFGRHCYFAERPTEVLVEIVSDDELKNQFIRINPFHRMSEAVSSLSEHWASTDHVEMRDDGINHEEGGWQKDINPLEIDQTTRYRKKVEREETYLSQISNLNEKMEHCILQNNAVDIYKKYYEDCKVIDYDPLSCAKIIATFRDPETVSRPVSCISWHPDGPEKVAVAHCVLDFQCQSPIMSTNSYIWRMDDIFNPDLVLHPSLPAVCIRYNPKDANLLAGGQYNGQVIFWDVRRSGYPVEKSAVEHSHHDPVYDIAWIHTKTGTECFSTATDGKVIWWDLRNMKQPLEELSLNLSRKSDAILPQGGTCLEYDATMPSKFLVGTESGNVILCSRKGRLPGEKIVGSFGAHIGPVYALQRNPFYPKNFLTVGDWSAKIWSEDGRESPIIWTPKCTEYLTSACWSAARPSVFFIAKEDGTMDVWDLMYKLRGPICSIGICNEPIYCISAQEQGEVIASGTKAGWLTIMHLGNGLINLQHNEKALFVLAIERGVKKEKILESKEREKKLMQKKLLEGIQDKSEHEENSKTVEAVLEAQKLFFDIIEKEIRKLQESSLQSQFNDTRKSKQLTFSEDGESFHTVKELDIKTVMVSELAKSIPFTTQGQVAMSYVQDKQNDEDFKSSKAATVEKHLPVIVSIEQFPSTVPTVQLESKSEAPLPVNPSEQLQHNSSAQTGNVLADISSKFLSKPQSEALPEHEKQLKIELRETDGTNHVASHAAEQPEETMSGSIA